MNTKENVFAEIDDAAPTSNIAVLDGEIRSASVRIFEFTSAEVDLAGFFKIDLSGSPADLVNQAAGRANAAVKNIVEAGLFLLAAQERIVSEQSDTSFKDFVEEIGIPRQRAYEYMSYAKFAATLDEEKRDEIFGLGKIKVLELAKADPEVVADLFADEDMDIQAISVRELKQRIREEKAARAQTSVELKKTELENEKLQAQLQAAVKSRADSSDIVPPHVSDIRLETAALYKKAELSIDGIARLTPDIHLLDGEWALSSARSAFAALQGLIAQAKGVAAELHRTYGADLDGDHSTMERLTQKELFKCATEYREIVGEHEHEAALRAYERDLEKPKGKGRPKAPPKLD